MNHREDSPMSSNDLKHTRKSFSGASGYREPWTTINALPLDITLNNTRLFEVMYVGKIKVSNKKVPITFIDDAIPKFKLFEAEKLRKLIEAAKETTNNSELKIVEEDLDKEKLKNQSKNKDSKEATILSTNISEENKENNNLPVNKKILLRGQSHMNLPNNFEKPKPRGRSSSIGALPLVEPNRTMVFLVSSIDLRLISPDRKQILLHKYYKDVASCIRGERNDDHFGIICKGQNTQDDGYVGYVFKCQSNIVSGDITICISQAFNTNSKMEQEIQSYLSTSAAKPTIEAATSTTTTSATTNQIPTQTSSTNSTFQSCEHCPMQWYHNLCQQIDGLRGKKLQTIIFRQIEELEDDEQTEILTKYFGAEKEMVSLNVDKQSEFLIMLIRAHCESRQRNHIHDTAENRSEFLNQYLGGSTIFMKAKRSLTSSFDQLLKRKNTKEDLMANVGVVSSANGNSVVNDDGIVNHLNGESSGSGNGVGVGGGGGKDSRGTITNDKSLKQIRNHHDKEDKRKLKRPRASSVGANVFLKEEQQNSTLEQLQSPMMNIFTKVGNSPKSKNSTNQHAGSWRQELFKSIITPSKESTKNLLLSPHHINLTTGGGGVGGGHSNEERLAGERHTTEELRQLWRKAIRQTILLVRMEKENARLQAHQNNQELKKIKLDYDEIIVCDKQANERWDTFMGVNDINRITNKRDPKVLLQAIRAGVPRQKRGNIWLFLVKQFSINTAKAPIDAKQFPNYSMPYDKLLKNLTEHQHAIFIDLGRTFPSHSFYKTPLGHGQLSLFNILKAYSILDPELGYCQGLGFICAVLLLHCEEFEVFNLLKHLMFARQMRTNYLPHMKQFQLQLYQFSRLIRDRIPDLYEWLDRNDVSPTLYAAPWILTVFSSQFPLGFVVKIFDLIFLDSPEVIFKVGVAILNYHKEQLLEQSNFEEIMEYLKTIVPKIDRAAMDAIMKDVFTMDIHQQLSEYSVEYNVLQEEISTVNHNLESLQRENEKNKNLKVELQIAESSIVQLEANRGVQQIEIQKLRSQIQSLEVTVSTLGYYIYHLVENNQNVDLPGNVRRIVQQIINTAEDETKTNGGKSKRKPTFLQRKIGKSMSVNSQLGVPLKLLDKTIIERNNEESTTTTRASDELLSIAKPLKKVFFDDSYQQQKRHQSISIPPILCKSTENLSSILKSEKEFSHSSDNLTSVLKKTKFNGNGSATSTASSSPLSSSGIYSSNATIVETSCDTPEDLTNNISPISNNNNNNISSSKIHPLSNCEDVHFQFNGTTQLKSIRSGYSISQINNKNDTISSTVKQTQS